MVSEILNISNVCDGTGGLRRLCRLVAEAMWFGCGGYVVWLRRLCGLVVEAMWFGCGGYVSEN